MPGSLTLRAHIYTSPVLLFLRFYEAISSSSTRASTTTPIALLLHPPHAIFIRHQKRFSLQLHTRFTTTLRNHICIHRALVFIYVTTRKLIHHPHAFYVFWRFFLRSPLGYFSTRAPINILHQSQGRFLRFYARAHFPTLAEEYFPTRAPHPSSFLSTSHTRYFYISSHALFFFANHTHSSYAHPRAIK